MKSVFRNYLNNTSGNIAMIFGIGIVVVVMTAGVAFDLSRMVSADENTQKLADMATLAAAASGEQDPDELQLIATNVVNSNKETDKTYSVALTVTEANQIRVAVSSVFEYTILKGFGFENPSLTSVAEAPPRGDGKLNLAMVLDVTGSMEGDKLTALQGAANDLIDTFDTTVGGTAPSGNVMMSVVPFARYVKIPESNEGKPWLEVEADAEHCWNSLDMDASVCGDDYNPNADEEGTGDRVCDNPVYVEKCADLSWSGCMGSREAPWHQRKHYVPGKKLQGFAGGGSCHSELLPLTTDFTAIRSNIDGLTAEDLTYIPAGLVWGWRTLAPVEPFIEADTVDKDERTNALLLMTDGNNTRSYGGTNDEFNGVFHWNSDQEDADTMTLELCDNIKDDDITIYTVAFEVTDSDTIDMLQACASDSTKFFDTGDAVALEEAFGTIGQELAEVRLSK